MKLTMICVKWMKTLLTVIWGPDPLVTLLIASRTIIWAVHSTQMKALGLSRFL